MATSACEAAVLAEFGSDDEVEQWAYAQLVSLFFFVLLLGVYFLPMVLTWRRRMRYPVTLKPPLLLQAHVFGFTCILIITIGPDAFGRDNIPCDLLLWARTLIIPLIIGPFVLLLAQLRNRVELAKAMLDFKVGDLSASLDALIGKARKAGWLRQLKILFIVLLPTAAYAAISYRKPYYGRGCKGCGQETEESIVVAACAVISFVWCVVYLRRMEGYEDPLGLRADLKQQLLVASVGSIAFVVLNQVDPGDVSATGRFNHGWLLIFVSLFTHFKNCVIPLLKSYLETSRRVQAQADLHRHSMPARKTVRGVNKSRASMLRVGSLYSMTTSSVGDESNEDPEDMSLTMLLTTTDGTELLEHFLSLEFNLELLKFLVSAREWRMHYMSTLEITARDAVARQIYDVFIRDGAPMMINLGSDQRRTLVEAFEGAQVGHVKPPTVFDAAIDETFMVLERDAFVRFKRTAAFKSFATGV